MTRASMYHPRIWILKSCKSVVYSRCSTVPKQSSCTTTVLGGSVVTVSKVQCASSRGGQVVRY